MVQQTLRDVFQTIFKEAFSLPAMMQNLYLLDVFVNIDAKYAIITMENRLVMRSRILRNEEPDLASLSNADASLVYVTRCTLQRAYIIMLIALILAKFIPALGR